MKARRFALAALAAPWLLAGAMAAPFTPASDAEVVERLPVAGDPALRAVESLRRQLASRPADTALRLDIAQRYFALAMAQGDPRYVGYATAALAPLERSAPADARYWLVRGQLQQYGHDFDGGLASLRRASELAPANPEPVAWRAAIHMVQARYDLAAAECARIAQLTPGLPAVACQAYVQAATGGLRGAYDALLAATTAEKDAAPAMVLWVQTRLAEMALRLQRWDDAERHYRVALAQGITDQFLLASYADFLLQRGRPREVLQLLAGWERSDVLLLRLALAGRAANDARAKEWSAQLAERIRAAAQRGDTLHEQEAARWALELQNDPAAALAYAKSNYARQKEPRDAEILLRAALAAGKPKEAEPALAWLRASGYEDAVMGQLAEKLR